MLDSGNKDSLGVPGLAAEGRSFKGHKYSGQYCEAFNRNSAELQSGICDTPSAKEGEDRAGNIYRVRKIDMRVGKRRLPNWAALSIGWRTVDSCGGEAQLHLCCGWNPAKWSQYAPPFPGCRGWSDKGSPNHCGDDVLHGCQWQHQMAVFSAFDRTPLMLSQFVPIVMRWSVFGWNSSAKRRVREGSFSDVVRKFQSSSYKPSSFDPF
ncbi:hypothetical protein B0H11DRAFT_1934000 [Mycena galericulata]|nr:hypothetical protein B0H11DRAFT_1933979 [Mycena galericulata]KAJ7440113.1 hypothetical protein B0H11DRAFT_1934000 [Mycena galericulata]